jgi:hypothetical protein
MARAGAFASPCPQRVDLAHRVFKAALTGPRDRQAASLFCRTGTSGLAPTASAPAPTAIPGRAADSLFHPRLVSRQGVRGEIFLARHLDRASLVRTYNGSAFAHQFPDSSFWNAVGSQDLLNRAFLFHGNTACLQDATARMRTFGARLAHCSAHRLRGGLACSPSSTRRRIASARDGSSSCASRHASIERSVNSCQRVPICSPLPVVFGRPRLFLVSRIDFLMI